VGNNLLTPSMITRYSIKLFINTNFFIQNINRQYDERFGQEGARIGAQLRIRLPNDYTVTDGPGISLQDTIEQQDILTVSYQRHVDVAFTTAERTLDIDDYAERILMPRVNVLAGNVAQTIMYGSEGGVCNISANVDSSNNILAVNSTPVLNAGALLDDNSAPYLGTRGERKLVNDPHTDAKLSQSLQGLFNPVSRISQQFETGTMKNALGFSMFRDQTVIKHTSGTQASGTLNGANQSGVSLTVTTLTGTLVQGDIITIAGVNAVNRVTKASTGQLRQFVVTANAAIGATTISIYPALIPPLNSTPYMQLPYTPQQYQTVTAYPASNAAWNQFTNASATYRKSIAYAPDAVTMVVAPLWMPPGGKGVVEAARHEMDDVSMRSLVCYEPGTDQPVDRLDVLFGYLYIRPEWASVVADSI
jgi:hypothetical protein